MTDLRKIVLVVWAVSGLLTTPLLAADASVDFSGVWKPNTFYATGSDKIRTLDGRPIPMTPAAEAEFKYLEGRQDTGTPVIHNTQMGWPKGFVQASRGNFNFEIVQEDRQITWFFEEDHMYFMTYLGTEHRPNLKPTFLGDSIFHWEGDTLVVDTIGYNGEAPFNSVQVSDKLHTVMRMRLINNGQSLENIITIEDPGTFTRPWQWKIIYDRRPTDERLFESVYAENNRNLPNLEDQ